MDINLRAITWLGSSLDDLKKLPKRVQREMGFSLHQVQEGKNSAQRKAFKRHRFWDIGNYKQL